MNEALIGVLSGAGMVILAAVIKWLTSRNKEKLDERTVTVMEQGAKVETWQKATDILSKTCETLEKRLEAQAKDCDRRIGLLEQDIRTLKTIVNGR